MPEFIQKLISFIKGADAIKKCRTLMRKARIALRRFFRRPLIKWLSRLLVVRIIKEVVRELVRLLF